MFVNFLFIVLSTQIILTCVTSDEAGLGDTFCQSISSSVQKVEMVPVTATVFNQHYSNIAQLLHTH